MKRARERRIGSQRESQTSFSLIVGRGQRNLVKRRGVGLKREIEILLDEDVDQKDGVDERRGDHGDAR